MLQRMPKRKKLTEDLSNSITLNTSKNLILADSIHKVNEEDWNAVLNRRNLYLSLEFLRAFEAGMGEQLDFYYAINYNDDGYPQLIAAYQKVKFLDKRKSFAKALKTIPEDIKQKLDKVFSLSILLCGNAFATGENGFAWSADLSTEEAFRKVNYVTTQLKQFYYIKEKTSVILFKEFWESTHRYSNLLLEDGYHGFHIDVNMVLEMRSNWKSFDDYLQNMKTKYRTRANSVLKKAEGIKIEKLSAAHILQESDRIEQLLKNVLDKSDFYVGLLTAKTLSYLSESLEGKFWVYGFFLGEDLVGFSLSAVNGETLEASYIGIDYNINETHAVYQRILYHYVEQAIEYNFSTVQFGRSSELMKSCIGAEPEQMKLYAKHHKKVPNLMLKHITQCIAPSDFTLRSPFKVSS